MKDIKWMNITVFIIFFGIALFEAVQNANWMQAGLFGGLGLLSLWADFSRKK